MKSAERDAAAPSEESSRARYSADELEQVVRRAAELQSQSGGAEPAAFSEQDVLRIAADVGISVEHVREALVEVRSQDLLGEVLDEDPLMSRIFSSPVASVSRRLPGERESVQARIESLLEQEQSLQPVRRTAGLSVWEPSGDLGDVVERLVDFGGRQFKLVEAEHVSLNVANWDRDNVIVRLSADLREKRNEWIGWWAAGIGVGLFLLWGVLGSALWAWLLLGVAGVAATAVALLDIRRSLRLKRHRFRLALEGLLDRLN
ncbi:hypothetical protein VCB98_04625 [Gammaproteobacteria bacterium AB-CW1]|uniref:Uncharacterized protein n=1 Tax=Natronospira elongata TaxID=3110268 RepID=A0AAP6JHQ1_9GAMM|nr:hypothetical protein [Gammaproteobacteria bacterium AB-CW1]